jgi:hypothetical protein
MELWLKGKLLKIINMLLNSGSKLHFKSFPATAELQNRRTAELLLQYRMRSAQFPTARHSPRNPNCRTA